MYKLYNGSLFDYSAGIYCGVLVKESTMKKLVKLQTKHLEEVKRVLTDGVDKGEVFSSSWTLHYPNGVQTVVRFIDPTEDIRRRINSAVKSDIPKLEKLVFIAESADEAKNMADERSATE